MTSVVTTHTVTVSLDDGSEQVVRFLSAGTGDQSVVLLHGWPQSSHEWRKVMAELPENYRVIAPDLRGIGGTSAPSADGRKHTLAGDIHALAAHLGLGRPLVVGHDIGGMVAYAYARAYPDATRGAIVVEGPLPGVGPWEKMMGTPMAWHFAFNKLSPLAEDLVDGRQSIYFRHFFDSFEHVNAMTGSDVAAYADAYGSRSQLLAGFNLYRSLNDDVATNRSGDGRLDVPMLVAGAEFSAGKVATLFAEGLRELNVSHVENTTIPDSGHWVTEENPTFVATLIEKFMAAHQ